LVLLCGPAVLGIALDAQEQARFTAAVQLVEVYATVTDDRGALVTGLGQADFDISEDGQPQEVTVFASGEFPLSVVLGVDRSWSMAGEPLRLARQASRGFLHQLRPGDRSMVVAISSDAEVIAPMGTDRLAQDQAIAILDPWSTTALHDALISSLDHVKSEQGRQALIVFSDGADRYSRATAADVVDRARRSQTLVYPIVMGTTRPRLLAELAVVTGGRSFLLRDARALEETLGTIARELRHQYLLGYVPSQAAGAGSPQWRSIHVSLRNPRPGVRVRARDGYMSE
jgi:Ca-activated chloride channel family protein